MVQDRGSYQGIACLDDWVRPMGAIGPYPFLFHVLDFMAQVVLYRGPGRCRGFVEFECGLDFWGNGPTRLGASFVHVLGLPSFISVLLSCESSYVLLREPVFLPKSGRSLWELSGHYLMARRAVEVVNPMR